MEIIKYLFLFLSVISFSCNEKSNPVTLEINFEYFYNSWKNSYEEQIVNDPVRIFRPCDYKVFPLSRYREELIFAQEGSCSFFVFDQKDRHHFQNGKWNLEGKNTITILDSTNTIYKKFQVTELKRDILKFMIVN